MNHTLLIEGQEQSITIRTGEMNDVSALVALNKKWQRNLLGVNTKKGFLSGSFNAILFEELIQKNMVTVAVNTNGLQAYMLSANDIEEGILLEHKEVVASLKTSGKIDVAANVAVGIQTAVEEHFHGTGLIVLVRSAFKDLLRNRFQYLFTTISKENHRSYKSATNYGWQVMGSNEEHYYLILTV